MIDLDLVRDICYIDRDSPVTIVKFGKYKDVAPVIRSIKKGQFVVVHITRVECSLKNVSAIAEMIEYHVNDPKIKYRSYPSDMMIKFYK